jgi:hypothetical protein
MTTNDLPHAIAFARSDVHEGDHAVILSQAKAACRTLADEVERLAAIKNALPVTADGVRIVPWPPTVVYRRITYHGCAEVQASNGFASGAARFDAIADGDPSCGYVGHNVALCYSTREAMEAAERSEG